MDEVLKVNVTCEGNEIRIPGRELHQFLMVETRYNDWLKRMSEYGFVAGLDYHEVLLNNEKNPKGGRPAHDHLLSIDMAKELCMLQRTERGKKARRYFLELERRWNSPEAVLERAFKLNYRSAQINDLMNLYQAKQKRLAMENEELRKKGRYYDELVDKGLNTTFRETAKELCVGECALTRLLLDMQYLYRDRRGRLMPYAPNDGKLFSVKEYYDPQTAYVGVCTYVTPAGRKALLPLVKRYLEGGTTIGG